MIAEVERIRVASLQYFIRPVQTFDQFHDQVAALVETAADYDCHLMVFPEYFTVQLLTLGNVKRPIREQIRDLAAQVPRFVEMMSGLAKKNHIYVVAGTIPVVDPKTDKVYNDSYIFAPSGEFGVQGKIHMTRFESEDWKISPTTRLRTFETNFGKAAYLRSVPSCTDDRQGMLRVRYCAQARAIENQLYVITAHTVGSIPAMPAVSLNYGQAAILTPSDFPFSRDGILAEGNINTEMMVIGELNLATIMDSRSSGTVLPLHDSRNTAEVLATLQEFKL